MGIDILSPAPKVSVLMPVYNTQEDHLRSAIDSILSQTYTDFEFLILNDASTDANVEKVVRSYDDSRIVYSVNERNMGISATRNRLIHMAKGEYLAVFDHDDISHAQRLAEEAAYLDEHPQTGVVSTLVENRSSKKTTISEAPENSNDIKRSLMTSCVVSHSGCMIRKSVLINHHIQYEAVYSPSEDYALFCRLVNKTEFHIIQKVLLYYRDHIGNTTHLKKNEMERATLAIEEFVRRNNPELWDLVRVNAVRKHRFLLFKSLKLIKIVETINRKDFYLFSCIPIFSIQKERWVRK